MWHLLTGEQTPSSWIPYGSSWGSSHHKTQRACCFPLFGASRAIFPSRQHSPHRASSCNNMTAESTLAAAAVPSHRLAEIASSAIQVASTAIRPAAMALITLRIQVIDTPWVKHRKILLFGEATEKTSRCSVEWNIYEVGDSCANVSIDQSQRNHRMVLQRRRRCCCF